MLCESTLNKNGFNNPWTKRITKKNKRRSGAPSSSAVSSKTSSREYTSGAKFRAGKLSSKTSGSPEATNITPEKDNDVEMNEADGVGAAADAGGSGEGSDSGGKNSEDEGDAEMGEEGSDAMEVEGEESGGGAKASSLDKLAEAAEGDEAGGDQKSDDGSEENPSSDKKSEKGAKTNSNGEEAKKSPDPSKKDPEKAAVKKDGVGESGEKGEPELSPEDAACPVLVGTLAYSDRDNLRRHIIRGNWRYEGASPQRFELIRTIPPEENLRELPKDGEFNGSFNVQHQITNSKGKIKIKNRAVQENGVMLRFTPKGDDGEFATTFSVSGKGANEFGEFELFGTATKNDMDGDDDPTYSVSVRKRYIPKQPAADPKGGKKDKKRKHASDAGSTPASDGEDRPPPTELTGEGVCLRGRLVRNTSEELSLDNAAVHRITGVWALKGISKTLEDPDGCEKFEYEHKCSGDSTVFPLSGRYTGFFYVSNTPGQRNKIAERDVVLKFRPNNAGHYNVEGKGSNIYGKYTISGALEKDGTITLFRSFMAPKAKASKKSKQAKVPAPVNGSSSGRSLPKAGSGPPAAPLLSFDNVKAPEGDGPVPPLNPPEKFTALHRGILKIENDGTHTCSGSWAMTNEHFQEGITSKYHFGMMTENAADDAKVMLERMSESGMDKGDDRKIKDVGNDSVSPVTLAHLTFPIDSTQYKGNFKMRKGGSRNQTVIDRQIVLKYVKNTGGSYNVYGKGVSDMGTFDLMGTLILQGKTKGLMQLYRIYDPPEQASAREPASRTSAKVFRGSLTEKAVDSGPVPAMKPPEPFTASTSGLLRRESARMSRLPSRLEEDDPEAHMDRLMEKCRQILKELQESDTQKIFTQPVDPIALGIPTYLQVIKTPMDLGTIQTKMDNQEIDSPEEFARLVRLTYQNAITFNTAPENPVHALARGNLVIFNKKFGTIDKAFNAAKKNKKLTKAERQELKRKEKEAAKEIKRKAKEEEKRKRKAEVEASNEAKRMKLENIVAANKSTMAAIAQAAPTDPDANMTRSEFNLLVQAIKQVQDQIVGLHKLLKKKSPSNAAPLASSGIVDTKMNSSQMSSAAYAQPSLASEPKASSQPSKPKKKKPKKEPEPSPPPSPKEVPPEPPVVEELSYEEKEELSESINLLPDRLLPAVMQIIREADLIDDDDEEIDLDIDQLDTKTQRKLQSFVLENVKQKKKKKPKQKPPKAVPAAPAPAPAAPSDPSPPPPQEDEEEQEKDTKPAATSVAPQGGKSFGNPFGSDLDDDSDSDDDDKEDEEDAMPEFDFTNLGDKSSSQDDAEEGKNDGDDSDKDAGDDLWEESRRKAKADKALAEDRAKREEKMLAEKEKAEKKRMAEALALGEQAKAKRAEEEAAEARRLEEQEREAEEARKAAREMAQKNLESVQTTIDTGDLQRDIMKQYEEEFNDNYSDGASPSSDFGF